MQVVKVWELYECSGDERGQRLKTLAYFDTQEECTAQAPSFKEHPYTGRRQVPALKIPVNGETLYFELANPEPFTLGKVL